MNDCPAETRPGALRMAVGAWSSSTTTVVSDGLLTLPESSTTTRRKTCRPTASMLSEFAVTSMLDSVVSTGVPTRNVVMRSRLLGCLCPDELRQAVPAERARARSVELERGARRDLLVGPGVGERQQRPGHARIQRPEHDPQLELALVVAAAQHGDAGLVEVVPVAAAGALVGDDPGPDPRLHLHEDLRGPE